MIQMKKDQMSFYEAFPEWHFFGCGDKHKHSVAHQAQEDIIGKVEQHRKEADLRELSAQHCGPAGVGYEIKNECRNSPAKPDLFFLFCIIYPVGDEHH